MNMSDSQSYLLYVTCQLENDEYTFFLPKKSFSDFDAKQFIADLWKSQRKKWSDLDL